MPELPADRPRPHSQSFGGGRVTFRLPASLHRRLEEVARRHGATLVMVLLAGFDVLLQCYSGQDDLVVGSPVANRNRREIEDLIGFFVNTLVLRADLGAVRGSFAELLAQVREATLGAYDHQNRPFEKLVEELFGGYLFLP